MRILISLPLLAAVVSSISFAASTEATRTSYKPAQQSNVVFAPTLGTTFTQITGGAETTSFATGFNAGVTADIGGDSTVFHTGLLFSQLNSEVDVRAIDMRVNVTFVQNFLSVPVQAKTYLSGTRDYQPYVTYGGILNFMVGAKMKALGQSFDMKDQFNTLNLLGSLGAGVKVPTNSGEFTVDASFNRSINAINAKGDESAYNQTFMLNAGLML